MESVLATKHARGCKGGLAQFVLDCGNAFNELACQLNQDVWKKDEPKKRRLLQNVRAGAKLEWLDGISENSSCTQFLQKTRKFALQKAHAVSQQSSSRARLTNVHTDEITTAHLVNLSRVEPELWAQLDHSTRWSFQGFHRHPKDIQKKHEGLFDYVATTRQPLNLPDPGDAPGPGGMEQVFRNHNKNPRKPPNHSTHQLQNKMTSNKCWANNMAQERI